jgi:hypothetical protein
MVVGGTILAGVGEAAAVGATTLAVIGGCGAAVGGGVALAALGSIWFILSAFNDIISDNEISPNPTINAIVAHPTTIENPPPYSGRLVDNVDETSRGPGRLIHIEPVVWPTVEELERVKQRVVYKEGCFHFAVTGVSGSGKSSFVNAIRGLRDGEPGVAPVGVVECTTQITRYPDPHRHKFIWYDVPGAGTPNVPAWQYFNTQGLYVFDCMVILMDMRMTTIDISILMDCARFGIPTYIVRSKSNQHIRNLMADAGYDSDDDDPDDSSQARRLEFYNSARENFISETQRTVRECLRDANLPQQRVYIVSKEGLRSIVRNANPKNVIHDIEFLYDVMADALRRRPALDDENQEVDLPVPGNI